MRTKHNTPIFLCFFVFLGIVSGCGDIPFDVNSRPVTLEGKDIFGVPTSMQQACFPAAVEQTYLTKVYFITKSQPLSSCELNLINSGRLKIKQIELDIQDNTLNFSIPMLDIYIGTSQADLNEFKNLDASKLAEFESKNKLILIGSTPAIGKSQTGKITISGDNIPAEAIKALTAETVPMVINAAGVVPPVSMHNSELCYARPTGALKLVPSLKLDAFPTIQDIGCS
jgi:hypothetical protein